MKRKTVASLHGRLITATELKRLEAKWRREDKAYWANVKKEEIARQQAWIAKLRKMKQIPFVKRQLVAARKKLSDIRKKKI